MKQLTLTKRSGVVPSSVLFVAPLLGPAQESWIATWRPVRARRTPIQPANAQSWKMKVEERVRISLGALRFAFVFQTIRLLPTRCGSLTVGEPNGAASVKSGFNASRDFWGKRLDHNSFGRNGCLVIGRLFLRPTDPRLASVYTFPDVSPTPTWHALALSAPWSPKGIIPMKWRFEAERKARAQYS